MILHITTHDQWENAREQGVYTAPSLHSEGFIHCSTLKQTVDTANIFFRGQRGMILLCIDEHKLKAECKYEDPTGDRQHDPGVGTLFPHIYGPINNNAVIKVVDFPLNENGLFTLPKSLIRSSLMVKAFLTYSCAFIFISLLIFLPAGSLKFWNAWIFIGVLFTMMLAALIYLLINDPGLIQKRMKTNEKEKTQKIYTILSLTNIGIVYIIPGLDFRYHWSTVPLWLVIVAALIMVFGLLMFFLVMKQNSYASSVIEIQEGQKIIDTGLYSIVRHPLYMSFTVIYCTIPFVLGSFYALIPILFIPLLLVVRILNEEEILKKELEGYEEYMKKVRYRFIPFIW